jgi:hypothetical protein
VSANANAAAAAAGRQSVSVVQPFFMQTCGSSFWQNSPTFLAASTWGGSWCGASGSPLFPRAVCWPCTKTRTCKQ